MDIISSTILGLIQGLTEFIPVSSSGHLIIFSNLLHLGDNTHLFVQSLDIGTTIALIIFFRRKILVILRKTFIERDYRLAINIALTCLPVMTVGILVSKFIEGNNFFINSLVIATALLAVGVLMIFLEKLPRMSKVSTMSKLPPLRALGIGIAQCLALIPGTSRSGSTIIGASISGMSPKLAAEYSFIVSIPVMLALIGKLFVTNYTFMANNWSAVLIGNLASFGAGIIAVSGLLSFLSNHSLRLFGVYRIIFALAIVIMVTIGLIH